jgi:signal transduction histidine kinase
MIAVTPASVEHPSRDAGTRPLVETGRKLIPLFLVCVLAIYVQLALLLPGPLMTPARLLLGLICLAYLVLGTVGYWLVNESRAGIWLFAYFVAGLFLGVALLFVSPVRGSIILVLFPLIAQAVVLLPPSYAILVTVVASVATVLESAIFAPHVFQGVVNRLGALAAFGFTYWFGRVLVREELGRQRAEGLSLELRDANDRLKDLAAQTHELGVMRERERLAREVHDGLGHYLTAIAIQNEAARELMSIDATRATDAMAKVQSLAQEALADVRRSINAWHIHQPAVSLARQV